MIDEPKENENSIDKIDYWEAWVKAQQGEPRIIAQKLVELEKEVEAGYRDELTGLLNRKGLTKGIEHMEKVLNIIKEKMVILFMDLDGLKKVNDLEGHEAGDKLIKDAAFALKSSRASDLYGRWGADEFVVALSLTDTDGAMVAVSRLQKALEENNVSASIGVAINLSGLTAIETINKADIAMMNAKNEGLRPGERGSSVGVVTIEV